MTPVIQPFHLLVIALAGWLNRQQQVVIDYLIEENRVLKEQLEGNRLRFTDERRIRLAVNAKVLGRLVAHRGRNAAGAEVRAMRVSLMRISSRSMAHYS